MKAFLLCLVSFILFSLTSAARVEFEFVVQEAISDIRGINKYLRVETPSFVPVLGSDTTLPSDGSSSVIGTSSAAPLYDPQFVTSIKVINGQYPAPAIIVDEGDEVVINVTNALRFETTSIHFHGIQQIGTPYSDGTDLTQCPIMPGETYTYRFFARPAGTHFYHSHITIQDIQSLSGPLIVRPAPNTDPHANLYQAGNEMIVSLNVHSRDTLIVYDKGEGRSLPSINGQWGDGTSDFPLPSFDVQSTNGACYRWRLINEVGDEIAGTALVLSIAGHDLNVIALDGEPIQPFMADMISIGLGQRIDFIVCPRDDNNDNAQRSFLITVRPSFGGALVPIKLSPLYAWMNVNGATNPNVPSVDTAVPPPVWPNDGSIDINAGRVARGVLYDDMFNALMARGIPGVTPAVPATNHEPLVMDLSLSVGNPLYASAGMFMSQSPPSTFNLESTPFVGTESPLLFHGGAPGCGKTRNIYKFNQTDEPVVVDVILNNLFGAQHPMHLHGGSFWVLGNGITNTGLTAVNFSNTVLSNAPCRKPKYASGVMYVGNRFMRAPLDSYGCPFDPQTDYKYLNLVDPPKRDVVLVPPHTWTVIRMRFDNPGAWYFHCHTMTHRIHGMLAAFMIGARATESSPATPGSLYYPALPAGTKQCGRCRSDGYDLTGRHLVEASNFSMAYRSLFLFLNRMAKATVAFVAGIHF